MEVVNEKSSALLSIDFSDEEGNPVQPSSGTYRIDDSYSDKNIKADTPFTPSSTTHEILITKDDNAIVDTSQPSEVRIVTVTWTYGGGRQGVAEFRYELKNLKKKS